MRRAGYEGIAFLCPSVPGQRKAGKENTHEENTNEEHTNLIPDNFYCFPVSINPEEILRKGEEKK